MNPLAQHEAAPETGHEPGHEPAPRPAAARGRDEQGGTTMLNRARRTRLALPHHDPAHYTDALTTAD
ncbi:hypothetical protein AB0H97_01295 [Streptomyces sp. NPDC050788]|jgi:hypothetical protein|uniref:hypothetical protein n=1 Tax=Streptomyces sp. NPDC050788 TaxID=3155041 RepID=UPI003411FD59